MNPPITDELPRHPAPLGVPDRRLNICLISEEFPPETGWGGIGTYAYNLAVGLVELGHRVHVIARSWGPDVVQDVDGARVYRVSVPDPSWRRGTYFVNLCFSETREVVLWNYQVSKVIRRIAAAETLDVIESPEYRAQGLLAALGRRSVPLVVKLHTPAFLCRQVNGVAAGASRWDTFISEYLEYRLVKCARLVTSPSRALAEEVARTWPVDPSSVRIIPNPLDETLFQPIAGERGDDHTVLYVGRLERRKGVETLIDAWPMIRQAVPGVRARLVGQDHPSGPGGSSMKAHLRDRLAEAGVPPGAVEFTGTVERTALPAMYRSAAVCVIPSLYENFPYTCLEAMACGCAVVGSEIGGIPEMITDESNGLLVPPHRPELLAAAVTRLLLDPSLRRRLGERARRTVCTRFSRNVVCKQTLRAYTRLIGRSKAPFGDRR